MTRKPPTSYAFLKYSGLALQLFVLLGIAAWLGGKVDRWLLQEDHSYFTILLILLFAGGFFYRLFKELSRTHES